MKETGLTGKRRSTTIAATPDDGNSHRKRRRRRRSPLSIETGAHAKRRNLTHIAPVIIDEIVRSGRLRWFGHDQGLRSTSPAK